MPTKSERTALVFVVAVVLAGGVVRLVRAARGGLVPSPSAAAALDQQRRATDSLARVPKAHASERPRAPRRSAGRGRGTTVPKPPEPSFPIDVDRAAAKELQSLPRVGPALAARIVAEREARGPFGSLDSLDSRVKGIGTAMANALRQFVTFSGR